VTLEENALPVDFRVAQFASPSARHRLPVVTKIQTKKAQNDTRFGPTEISVLRLELFRRLQLPELVSVRLRFLEQQRQHQVPAQQLLHQPEELL